MENPKPRPRIKRTAVVVVTGFSQTLIVHNIKDNLKSHG